MPIPTNMTLLRIYSACYGLSLFWFIFLWGPIALFAAILALRQPR